jgi:peroxiredoxin
MIKRCLQFFRLIEREKMERGRLQRRSKSFDFDGNSGRYCFFAVLCSFLLISPLVGFQARADSLQSRRLSSLEVCDPVASATLSRIAEPFTDARSISYSANITESETTGAGVKTLTAVAAADAKLNRSGLWRMDFTSDNVSTALAVCGKKSGYAIDYTSKKYARFNSADAIAFQREALNQALPSLPSTSSFVLLDLSSGSSPFFLSGYLNTDAVAPDMTSVDLTNETYNGKSALGIVQSLALSPQAKISFKLIVDPVTYLPYQLRIDAVSGNVVLTHQEDYTDWKLNSDTFPDSDFDSEPPPGDKQVNVASILPVGSIAPNFEVVDQFGKTVHLSDFSGKMIIIDFWSTWRDGAADSLKRLDNLYGRVKDQGVVFLPVCVWDDKSAFDKWTVDKATDMPLFFDPAAKDVDKSIAISLYQVDTLPTDFVIAKDSKIVGSVVGNGSSTDHRLDGLLARLGYDVGARPEK